jgi:glutaredoxin-like protein NrdH
MTITVYVKSNCVQCTQTKKLLDKNNLPYNTISVEEDTNAYEYVVEHLGYKAAPVIVITDEEDTTIEHWSGFNPDKLNGLKNANL